MTYVKRRYSNYYIAHHGIKGQKWGTRNGPPYPLNSDAHSSSEKKAGWRSSLGGKSSGGGGTRFGNKYTDLVEKAYEKDKKRDIAKETKTATHKRNMQTFKSALAAAAGVGIAGLTIYAVRDQDIGLNGYTAAKALLGSGLMTTVGVTIVGANIAAGHKENASLRRIKKAKKKNGYDEATGFAYKPENSKLSPEKQKDADMKAVNPAYSDMSTSTKNNCMLCTTTYELRQRGYDVIANKVDSGFTTDMVKEWFPKAQIKSSVDIEKFNDPSNKENFLKQSSDAFAGKNMENVKNTMKMFEKEPDGSRGNIMVTWGYGMGGHSMAYEKQDGKLIVRDCQNGKKYTEEQFKKQILQESISTQYARLDNVDFDPKKIKGCAR